MNKYFLTYGDKNFYYSKKHLSYLAKESGFFDKVISLGPEDLDKDFLNKYIDVLSNKRGGGYWIWKHEIINSLLKNIDNGDIILYCDAGSSINTLPKAKKRFKEYFDLLLDSKNSFLRFETEKQFLEKQFTSSELFKYFDIGLDTSIANSTQLQAGVMFFQKSYESLEFFNDYKNVLNFDINLITDSYVNNQDNQFIENRHDQSIFSILGKFYDSIELENETEFRNRKELQYDYPILTVRASNHGLKDKVKLMLFKSIYAEKTKFF